jgi:hypothetical protein
VAHRNRSHALQHSSFKPSAVKIFTVNISMAKSKKSPGCMALRTYTLKSGDSYTTLKSTQISHEKTLLESSVSGVKKDASELI